MKVTDPVCGMSVESGQAAATENHDGQTLYFCSTHCRDTFKTNPARYAGKGWGKSGAEAGHGDHGHGTGHRH